MTHNRSFTLQLYDRIEPPPPYGAYADAQQRIFVALRRLIVIQDDWAIRPEDDLLLFEPKFQQHWLEAAQVDPDTEISLQYAVSCRCQSCTRMMVDPNLTSNVNQRSMIHVQARIDAMLPWVSVGLMALNQDGMTSIVYRDWEPKPELLSDEDYTYAIGLAIDDAIHRCERDSLNRVQLRAALITSTEEILKNRVPEKLEIDNIAAAITNPLTPSQLTFVKVAVNFSRLRRLGRTMVVSRSLKELDLR